MQTLFLVLAIVSSGIKSVKIISNSGDVYISVADSIYLDETNGAKFQRNDHQITIVGNTEDINVTVPRTLETLIINTITGDIHITGDTLNTVIIKTISGDISVRLESARSLNASSSTGDITVHLERSDSPITLYSRTGDIKFYGNLTPKSTIKTEFGDIEVEGGKINKNVTIKSLFGEKEISTKSGVNFHIGMKKLLLQNFPLPFSSWKRFPIEYTRVDGLGVNFDFGGKTGDDFYRGYVGYGFSSRRFDFYLHARKILKGPLYLYMRGFSERRTPDAWKLSSLENLLSTLFLHEEFADYYLARGYGIYQGFRYKGGWIHGGYEVQNLYNLKKVSDWSIFYRKERTYPENPPINTGHVEFLMAEAGYQNGFSSIRLEAERQMSSSYQKFSRIFVKGQVYRKIGSVEVLMKASAGYADTTLLPPFDFTLGGPFTMPGFRWKEFRGDRWMELANLIVMFDIGDSRFFVRMDGAQTNLMNKARFDAGVGFITGDGVYIGISSPVGGKDFRLFAGLEGKLW